MHASSAPLFPSADTPLPGPPRVHAREHTLQFTSHGKVFQIVLERNDQLFSPSYGESYQYWSGGVRDKSKEPPPRPRSMVENCYYQGTSGGDAQSAEGVTAARGTASFHTCDHGFSGVVW